MINKKSLRFKIWIIAAIGLFGFLTYLIIDENIHHKNLEILDAIASKEISALSNLIDLEQQIDRYREQMANAITTETENVFLALFIVPAT